MSHIKGTIFLLLFLALVGSIKASDPLFKFVPRTTLTGLEVQHVTAFDIEMVVGSHAAAQTVISVNGPFEDGHAGMTGVSLTAVTQGSNVNAGDFSTAQTQTFSTAKDGQQDVIYKTFKTVSRTDTARGVVLDNTLKLQASMMTVDKPGASSSDTLWVRCSGEVGDEYVWVSEEATTIARRAGDRPILHFKLAYLSTNEKFFGSFERVEAMVSHTSESRMNAYNAKLRIYLPPYAKHSRSVTSSTYYSAASAEYITTENRNELVLTFPKVGISDKPTATFYISFDGAALRLRGQGSYDTYVPYLFSYCRTDTCAPDGAIDSGTDKFLIQHIPSGRCLSDSGATDGAMALKGGCNETFMYATNGGLQHVTSSECMFTSSPISTLNTSPTACTSGGNYEVSRFRMLQLHLWTMAECYVPQGSGKEGERVAKSRTCKTANAKFRMIDAGLRGSRFAMGQKVILTTGNGKLFFCNRQKYPFKTSCFFKNGTSESTIKALPSDMVYVKAWDAAKSHLYGIHQSGKSYAKIDLGQEPHVVYQLEDSLWSAIAAQPGIKLSTDIAQASLKDYPERQETSSFAVSLTGLYEEESLSTWKQLSRW